VVTDTLRVGIALAQGPGAGSFPESRAGQFAQFLAEALRLCPKVASVRMVNTSAFPMTTTSPQFEGARQPATAFDEVKDELDVLIELGSAVSDEQTAYLQSRGVRIVAYCCDCDYLVAAQSVLFGRPAFGSDLFVNQRYDAIWMLPTVAALGDGYWRTLCRRAPQLAPFVWSPPLLAPYGPRAGGRRVTVFGPNTDVQRFCLYPAMIVELAYRQAPDLLTFLHVTGAQDLATKSPEFHALMAQLDIVQQHKASFVELFPAPQFLADMTDVVVSHGWERGLDPWHLDICWQGYPLVHNDVLCPDLGYYYPENDLDEGARQLLRAMRDHDSGCEVYTLHQQQRLGRYLPASVATQYNALLEQLMAQAPLKHA
jgi:hypothetical protein